MSKFICPKIHKTLEEDTNGNLYCIDGNQNYVYKNFNGSIDFAKSSKAMEERNHYNDVYKDSSKEIYKSIRLDILKSIWDDPYIPWNKLLLNRLSNEIDGKTILLLGNGMSIKEFYFLSLGGILIYTDLSLNAVLEMKYAFQKSDLFPEFKERIFFHSIDALNLPFPDETIDIIYGYAFVHHLDDLDRLFSELNRVIRKGGKCVFFDNAYSPIWQLAKKTILKPLQIYSHKEAGISPEDLRATRKGGFREQEIEMIAKNYGFEKFFFDRTSFFLQLWSRGAMKLKINNKTIVNKGSPFFNRIDIILSKHSELFRRNQLNLVWGFEK